MLNRVTIMGRFCADPELKRTNGGTAVTSFSVAVERDFKGQNGERETDFIDVVAWKNTAEFVTKYFAKGRMAVIEGRLQTRSWKDQNGNNRKNTEIVAENIYFGDSKQSESYAERNEVPDIPAAAPKYAEIREEDGKLPF